MKPSFNSARVHHWPGRLFSLLLFSVVTFTDLPAAMSQGTTEADRPVVVTTFSVLGDLVQVIGGDDVKIEVLVGPDSDAHLYQPVPADSRLLHETDLVVVNGLGFEGWLDRLIAASGFSGTLVVASEGITPLQVKGTQTAEYDPHAWHDTRHIRSYLRKIRQAFVTLSPRNADLFHEREEAYLNELDRLDAEYSSLLDALPAGSRTIVTSHDAFSYLGAAWNLDFIAPVGLSTDSEATAKDVASLIRQIRQENISAVFVENITDPRLLERVTQETGARLGGVLYSDALSSPEGPAGTYLKMMRHNLHTLGKALAPESIQAPLTHTEGENP